MSVLWQTERNGTRYSVRAHGASVRLYSNGVFHSQWNPDRPFAGGVWDCLSLPALYRPAAALRRVLLLGVGGGAVIRQLQTLVPFESLTAVEIDPVHIDVARRWFGVGEAGATRGAGLATDAERTGGASGAGEGDERGEGGRAGGVSDASAGNAGGRITLLEADAIAWLRRRHDEPFDLVVDDLFGHADGEPRRACALGDEWVSLLRSAVTDSGLLVVNCVDGRELGRAAPVFADAGFAHARRWSLAGYENAIGVFGVEPLVPREWSRRLERRALPAAAARRARAIVRRPLRG